MKKGKEVKDKTRNNRFAAAFDWLQRNHGAITRKELAAKMGVSKDTITRIMHAYTPFTDDTITKFQTATGCIFNLQWLRGESDIMLSDDAEKKPASVAEVPHHSASEIDKSSLMNATIAAQATAIASLKRELSDKEESEQRELAAKEETINALRSQLKDKDAYIESLKQQVADLRATIAKMQAKDFLGNYPFSIGVAEEPALQQHPK